MIKRRIIAFFALIALFLVPVSVLADTYALPSFVNEYRHYMVAKFNNHGGYQVFCTNVNDPSELIKMRNEEGKGIQVTGNGVVRYYTEDYGITWSSGYQIGPTYWPTPEDVSQPILESTFIVKTPSGRVFFSPIGVPIMTLVETMRGVDSGILWKIISAGLTLLVGLIVLGTCFRKGWAFLQGQLRR